MFCPKCGAILKPKTGKLVCSCGYTTASPSDTLTEHTPSAKKVGVLDDASHHPTVEVTCPKCGHHEAAYWCAQTLPGDEPETQFYKCTKCNYAWREY